MNTFTSSLQLSDQAVWDICESYGFKRTVTEIEHTDDGPVSITVVRSMEDATEFVRATIAQEMLTVAVNTNKRTPSMNDIATDGVEEVSFTNMGDSSTVTLTVTK